ncbi:MAG TPA: iron-sulfur cluster assembly scaffold protein [bacterium]|nr:iron-sulfur cluster assembly scaffold protein [bacterium]
MQSQNDLEEQLEECKQKLQELERLKLVEESVTVGLREEGFSEKAIELFRYRKNFLTQQDPLKDEADAIGSFTGACGDQITTYLKLRGDSIDDAKYTTDGCPGAVTSASALIEMVKGKNINEAAKLVVKDVIEFLKEGSTGLPRNMWDCCGIAIGALRQAINNYRRTS